MNAEGAFDALWDYLQTLWRLTRECSTPMIWSCALVEIGWSLLWANALGLIAFPLALSLLLIVVGFSSMALATHIAKTVSAKLSPFFQRGHGSVRRIVRQENRHV